MPHIQDISILCADNVSLAATLFMPETPKGAVMIAPATGIKRRFYQAFATYLASLGWGVITFDNRGIGDSLNGHVKQSKATLQSWGEQDMPAVLEALRSHFPQLSYHLIGHSAGGQLVGLMPNVRLITSQFNVACSSGSLRNMTYPFKLQAHIFMNVFIPLNHAIWGFTNAQWMGMGEPLPKEVAKQWREWCNGKGYVEMAFGKSIQTHAYDSLTHPTCWVWATDDTIANEANVHDMVRVFTQVPSTIRSLHPQDFGLSHIGHMRFFGKENQVLWQIAVEWLEKNEA